LYGVEVKWFSFGRELDHIAPLWYLNRLSVRVYWLSNLSLSFLLLSLKTLEGGGIQPLTFGLRIEMDEEGIFLGLRVITGHFLP
jgi:hypothetical protein